MSTEVGRRSEQTAADFLRRRGYRALTQNWRTRRCEIDLIVSKRNVVYFVEVKYRSNSTQGAGLEYITSKKLAQMRFAAEFWLASHRDRSNDYCLAALEVSGVNYEVTAWIDNV